MVPANHLILTIKDFTDDILKSMAPTLAAIYAKIGRVSIPPERLPKSMIIMALYSAQA
ncbi:MAG: hypothetical protein OEY50_07190 [Nitrospinota bacterium]|nr:hypothetical protein [Nitrospinota bacterium]